MEEEYFIKEIELINVRYLDSFKITLSDKERKHLIFTGKNGCGKTTTLLEIKNKFIELLNNEDPQKYYNKYRSAGESMEVCLGAVCGLEHELNFLEEELTRSKANDNKIIAEKIIENEKKISNQRRMLDGYKFERDYSLEAFDKFSKIKIDFTNQNIINNSIQNGTFILAYFGDKRENNPTVPKGVQQLHLSTRNSIQTGNINTHFVQYMINQRMKMLDAKEYNDIEEVKKIEFWFKRFEKSLKKLYNEEGLVLKYNREGTSYSIEYGIKKFGLNELSAGYSSIISIITELILRMEAHNVSSYNMQGVVLIDEIETHLHVSLQKKILPFLTNFFPKIQFILSTHSPFVLSSLENSVIFDLERMERIEDLTAYSYESLVDSYFDTDKYSDAVKEKITRYEKFAMSNKSELSEDEITELLELKDYFSTIPKFQNEELGLEISRINRIMHKNK